MIACTRWTALVAVSVGLATIACGDDDSDDSGGSTGGGPGGPTTISIGGQYKDALTRDVLDGYEICTLQPAGRDPGCGTTDAAGKIIAAGYQTNQEILLEGKKDGYYPIWLPGTTPDEDSTDWIICPVKTTDVTTILAASGLTLEAGKGMISIIATDGASALRNATAGGKAGVTFTASPAAQVVYLKGTKFDATATETDSTGTALIFNVEANTEYTVKYVSPTGICETQTGWPGSADGERRVPTNAGTLSYFMVGCN